MDFSLGTAFRASLSAMRTICAHLPARICPSTHLISSLGTGISKEPNFTSGLAMTIGGKELELDHEITRADFYSGKCFSSGTPSGSTPAHSSSRTLTKQFVPLTPMGAPGHKSTLSSTQGRGIPLYPVNLMDPPAGKSQTPSSDPDSYWAANWQVLCLRHDNHI